MIQPSNRRRMALLVSSEVYTEYEDEKVIFPRTQNW